MLVPIAVRDVMIEDVHTIGPDETAARAAERLRTEAVGSLVVLDDGRPVGIVTRTDLLGVLADGRAPSTAVREVMSAPLVSVGPDEDVETAAERACEHDVEKLLVEDDGEMAGIVSTHDLATYFARLGAERPGEWPGVDCARAAEAARGRVSVDVRPDTAYEREDWEFEYETPEGSSTDEVTVGDVARFSKPLTDADVRAFADATGDTNRLHLDDRFAAGTRFGRRIVHGTLTTGVLSAALARLPGLTIYVSKEIHFVKPVDVGERVTAVCAVEESLGDGRYRLSCSVRNDEDEAVLSGSVTVLMDDLPAVEEEPAVAVAQPE